MSIHRGIQCRYGLDPHAIDGKGQGLLYVTAEVFALLNAAAEADEVIADTESRALSRRDGAVSHTRGQLRERLDTAEGLCEREEAGGGEERISSGVRRVGGGREVGERRVLRGGRRGSGAG